MSKTRRSDRPIKATVAADIVGILDKEDAGAKTLTSIRQLLTGFYRYALRHETVYKALIRRSAKCIEVLNQENKRMYRINPSVDCFSECKLRNNSCARFERLRK